MEMNIAAETAGLKRFTKGIRCSIVPASIDYLSCEPGGVLDGSPEEA
jgi:hypothetical protein